MKFDFDSTNYSVIPSVLSLLFTGGYNIGQNSFDRNHMDGTCAHLMPIFNEYNVDGLRFWFLFFWGGGIRRLVLYKVIILRVRRTYNDFPLQHFQNSESNLIGFEKIDVIVLNAFGKIYKCTRVVENIAHISWILSTFRQSIITIDVIWVPVRILFELSEYFVTFSVFLFRLNNFQTRTFIEFVAIIICLILFYQLCA